MMNTYLPQEKYISHLALKINNLQRSIDFYTQVLGFTIQKKQHKSASLSTSKDSPTLLIIEEINDVISKSDHTTGLYHFALRLPTDQALADLLTNILDQGWSIQGAADHIVSKAIYFSDPDGNGIEIYSDRPQDTWEWKNGEVSMSTASLDFGSLMQKASKHPGVRQILHPDSTIGHIHLKVSNLSEAEWFYHEIIGMDITQRSYPGALFFSFKGYHHHVGVNVWAGQDLPPQPSNAVGLQFYSLIIHDLEKWNNILSRLKKSGVEFDLQITDDLWDSIFLEDPSGNDTEIRFRKTNMN